jgi:hypothetical protein
MATIRVSRHGKAATVDLDGLDTVDELLGEAHRALGGSEEEDFTFNDFHFSTLEDVPQHMPPEPWDKNTLGTILEIIAYIASYPKTEGGADAWLENNLDWDKAEFEEKYIGKFDSDEEFGQHLKDECGFLEDLPEQYELYFDFDKWVRDLVSNGDVWEINQHWFWS